MKDLMNNFINNERTNKDGELEYRVALESLDLQVLLNRFGKLVHGRTRNAILNNTSRLIVATSADSFAFEIVEVEGKALTKIQHNALIGALTKFYYYLRDNRAYFKEAEAQALEAVIAEEVPATAGEQLSLFLSDVSKADKANATLEGLPLDFIKAVATLPEGDNEIDGATLVEFTRRTRPADHNEAQSMGLDVVAFTIAGGDIYGAPEVFINPLRLLISEVYRLEAMKIWARVRRLEKGTNAKGHQARIGKAVDLEETPQAMELAKKNRIGVVRGFLGFISTVAVHPSDLTQANLEAWIFAGMPSGQRMEAPPAPNLSALNNGAPFPVVSEVMRALSEFDRSPLYIMGWAGAGEYGRVLEAGGLISPQAVAMLHIIADANPDLY